MIQKLLDHQLDKVAARFRLLRLLQSLALVWFVAAAAASSVWGWQVYSGAVASLVTAAVIGGTFLLACGAVWGAWHSARNYVGLARRIEGAFPELRTCLLAALEQRPDANERELGYLQNRVIHEALRHARQQPWTELVSRRRLQLAAGANIVSLCLLGVALVGVAQSASAASASSGRTLVPGARELTMTIDPGNVEVERGASLLVLARMQGPMPAQATLHYRSVGGGETTLSMAVSLNDPIFGGHIPAVDELLDYTVEAADQSSATYHVTVFEYPRLERADARLVYPKYTALAERVVQDVRTVSVVEGTQLTLQCRLNKAIAKATLRSVKSTEEFEPIELATAGEANVYQTTIDCRQSLRMQLALVDEAGRTNQKVEQFTIHVLPNQPPGLKPLFPARDLEVSALEELDIKAAVQDDFGVERVGLTYSIPGQEPVDVLLAEKIAAKEKRELSHALRLEELHAEPDQLLSYHWWAEDFDATGKLRRTESDMYFAEVRPFEEIYRRGEQPPGGERQERERQQNQQGGGQNAQDAQDLAKLQKEIIGATWKLLRREVADELSDAFADDVTQVAQSQAAAVEKAEALGRRVTDDRSLGFVSDLLQQMRHAIERLEAARSTPAREPLSAALAAEQAAYQSLLRLRAREFEVVREQRQQSQSSSQQTSARSQQQREQMQQLEMREEENRYETQRTAQEQQQESEAERENRQVLNRLRELARRQHDLNERLKELQSSLEAAAERKEQEEVRRQLQRLQDEQRQILQDTDELQSRLNESSDQDRMADEQRQLDETRDQVRRASEAIEQERVSQAAAAGTRAEQQFNQLREEFRRRASQRFGEEMQQMRESARAIDERERDLAQQMRQSTEPAEGPPSLREDDRQEKVADQVAQQRQRLSELQEQMRDTIERAETTEPLLSERLYETARNLRDQSIDRALQSAARSARQGLPADAQQQERAAGEGVQRLREGIERAAEGVLGDEAEALRRARNELQDLARELNEELDRNRPPGAASDRQANDSDHAAQQRPGENERDARQATREQQTNPASSQRGPAQSEPSPPGKSQRDETQRGESQPGQPRPAQAQPGQARAGQRAQSGGQQPQDAEDQDNSSTPEQSGGQPQLDASHRPGQRQDQTGPGNQAGQRDQTGQRETARGGRPAARGATGQSEDYVPGEAGPLTGENFRQWSDRLRDVEEMVDDQGLRGEVARIRERAREMRAELKRHSAPPNWDLVRDQLAAPLAELEQKVSEELQRRTSQKAIVPLDRDPVPAPYSEKTRRYYERLGTGK